MATAPQRTSSARQGARPNGVSRRARGSMSRDEILEAARHLITMHGMRQLSMPGLARELGSGVTSIYWYFRNKDELLESLATEAMRESSLRLPPVGDGPWDEELVAYFGAFRALLHSNPVYREIGTYRPDLLTTMSLRAAQNRLEAGLGLLRRAGFSESASHTVFTLCSNYTRGFVALEQGVEAATRGATSIDTEYGAEAARVDDLGDESYRLGLRLLVAGIAKEYLHQG